MARASGAWHRAGVPHPPRPPAPTIELIRRAVRGDALVPPDDAFDVIRSRPHGHVAAVVGTARKVGLPGLLAAPRRRERRGAALRGDGLAPGPAGAGRAGLGPPASDRRRARPL